VHFPIADATVSPLLLALLGMIVGTMTGFFGVGGGFLITGGLLVLGVPTIYAVGTGLLMVMGTAITSTLRHRRLGNVDIRLAILIVCGTVPGGLIAERVNSSLERIGWDGPVIGMVYFVLLLSLGALMTGSWLRRLRNKSAGQFGGAIPQRLHNLRLGPSAVHLPVIGRVPTRIPFPRADISDMSVFVPVVTGFAIGFIALLLGAGGGFILMPFLVYGLGVPTVVAVGTDLFQIIITGSVGTFIYALGNHVDLLMAMIMLAAASVGSQIGATATRFVDSGRIRVLFGVTVLSGGVAVALKEVSESVSRLHFLDTVASALLLGVSGAICLVIAGLLLRAARRKPLAQGVEA
jgi:uncharacterized membrane protein YfcA